MSTKTRIIYYFVTSALLFAFGAYLYSQSNTSKGIIATVAAGIFQAGIASFLLYKYKKAKA